MLELKEDLSRLRWSGVKLRYGNQNLKLWGLTLWRGTIESCQRDHPVPVHPGL